MTIIEAIKTDLTTSNLTQKNIAEKHGVSAMKVCLINIGNIHPEVEPKTTSQIKREKEMDLRLRGNEHKAKQDVFELECKDQESLDFLLKEINDKPGWPKVVSIQVLNQEDRLWVVSVLKKREKSLTVQLARVTLMINAIETNDFSDLSPSALAEIEEAKEKIRAAHPTEDPQHSPQQPQPLKDDSPS